MAQLHCADGRCSIPLTARELEVLGLVAEFRTNPEIAAMLSISPRTVEYHLGNVLSKLGVASRRGAARLARQRGIVERCVATAMAPRRKTGDSAQ